MSAFSESNLPTSFLNEVESFSPNLIVVRSSVKNLEECNEWIKEYGKLSKTKWNSRTSNPSGARFVCFKKYVCHRSAFMKIPREANKKKFSKNENCMATIHIKIKLDTSATRKKDYFVKKGLCAVITITDTHNHSLNTVEALKFLPASECREKFIKYFKAGMSVIKACRYHEGILRSEGKFTEENMTNPQINPSYRSVQYWYEHWRLQNLGPRTGLRSMSSGTASREEEKKKDHIPLEPTILIKEEPLDYNPTPSTSTDTANEEFILPHEENTWTPPVPAPLETVVEPQFTLSVASLAVPNDPENPEGEQVKKKRKTNTSTFVPSTNGSEMKPQSPVYNFSESSNPGSSKDPRKDQFDVFGEYIAAKLRSLDRRSCAHAQKAIGDIIFEAEMGKFLDGDCDSKDLKNCAS
ncbi:unnamed protein product [Larinioides sclopetarius]|uniref:Uncharacterized protein n=1 Tax=Larinioides sclopetarius TaxID=280406 RepID=A0AAV1Z031_9ARAC